MGVSVWKRLRRWALAGSVAALCATGTLRAQEEPAANQVNDIMSRLQAIEKQNDELRKQIEARKQAAAAEATAAAAPVDDDKVKNLVDAYLQNQAEKKKQAEIQKKLDEQANGYVVGSDLAMTARWNPDQGLLLETAHKDFTFHIGGFFQDDSVWWNEGAALRKTGGEGTFEDGTFFRRVHLQMDGTAWEQMEFNLEYAFENFGNNVGTGALEQFFVGLKDMPFIGTVRIGQMRVPQGLEGDLVTGAKNMTFMERSSFTDAFYNNFGPGVWMGNHIFNDRVTWAAMAYRQEGQTISTTTANEGAGQQVQQGVFDGAAIADGNWAYSGRVTALPVYENDGRCLVHLGASFTDRSALHDGTVGGTFATGGASFVDFSARPEMRDTVGNYTNVGPGNAKRIVDTGLIQCDNASVCGLEYLSVHGPFSLQAEYGFADANGVTGVVSPTGVLTKASGTLGFSGGYIQASYFLTGEYRLYDRRLGRLGNTCVRPNTPFWFTRDSNGHLSTGLGAVELAARYSYLNLDDGPVQGGVLGSTTLGLNWYLNTNLKIQFEWLNSDRYGLNATSAAGSVYGVTNSFGIRTQIAF